MLYLNPEFYVLFSNLLIYSLSNSLIFMNFNSLIDKIAILALQKISAMESCWECSEKGTAIYYIWSADWHNLLFIFFIGVS